VPVRSLRSYYSGFLLLKAQQDCGCGIRFPQTIPPNSHTLLYFYDSSIIVLFCCYLLAVQRFLVVKAGRKYIDGLWGSKMLRKLSYITCAQSFDFVQLRLFELCGYRTEEFASSIGNKESCSSVEVKTSCHAQKKLGEIAESTFEASAG